MKFNKFYGTLTAVIMAGVLTLTGCQQPLQTTAALVAKPLEKQAVTVSSDIKVTENGRTAYAFLKQLEKQHANREAGTENERKASVDLADALKKMGYSPETQPFEYSENKTVYKSQNIIAVKNPEKTKRIIIGAHYDSVPIGNGMDDNGSGVAALLTVAKQLSKVKSDYRIDFVCFGAEEVGGWGSEYFAANMLKGGLAKPTLMINYDSLIAGDDCNVYVGKSKDPNLSKILALAKSMKLPLVTQNQPDSGLPYGMTLDASDHAPFKAKGIPLLYFEATNWSIGAHDGYTQTTNKAVKNGEIWHTDQDKLAVIEKKLGDRPLRHLSLFTEITLSYLKSVGVQ